MADYRAQHTRKTKKNHTLPRAAATLAITAGLAVSPPLQTAAFAQDNAGANCGDACKNGTQADWDACKQQVTDAKAALDAAQKKADDAQAKVDAAEKEEARTLKLKNSYTTLAKKAQAAYDAVKDQPGKVDEAQKALDKAEADKKQAEQDYADAQAALEKAKADEQDAAKKQADAKADYEAALERYTEVKNLADQLAARENAYSKAVQAKEDATLKADAARAKVTEKAKEFDAAKQAYEDAKKAVADAEAALNDATANKAAAQQRLDAAKKALAKAQATYDAAKAAYDEAKASLDDAQANLDKAVKAYDEALAAYKAAGNEWGDKLTSLQKTLDAKKADRDKAKSDLDRANKKLAAAQQDLEDWNGYKTAKVNPQLKKLQAAIENAQAEQAEAEKALESANAVAAEAQAKADSAQATYDAAQQQYAEAQAKYLTLEQAWSAARAKLVEMEQLAAKKGEFQKSYDTMKGIADGYKANTLDPLNAELSGAQKTLDLMRGPASGYSELDIQKQEAVVNTLKAQVDEATAKYNDAVTVANGFKAQLDRAIAAENGLAAQQDAVKNAWDAKVKFFYQVGTGVEALNTSLKDAEKTLNDRKGELATAQKAAADAQAKVDAKKQSVADAQTAYRNYAAEVQEKEDGYVNAVNAAKASVKATQTAYDEAKEAAADAQADYDAAYAGAQAALKDLSQKLMDSETVKDEWTAAVEYFTKLTKTTEADRIAAAEALVSAKDEESQADNANAFAAQAVKDAQQALNTANYNAMQAQIHQMWTQLAYVAAGEEAAKAQKVLDAATETLLKAAEAREESRKAAIELPGLKAELDDLNWVYYAAQANYKKAAAELKKAEDAEKLALKRKNSFTTLWKEAVKALDAAKADADAALIKAEATFDHIDGYFAKAGDLGINVAIPDTSDPVASDDFAGRLAILSTKLGQYAQVVAAAGTVYADAQTATADAKAELADAQDALAKAQDAYDLAVACYNSCEEKGYHKAKAEEKKDEAKKPAEKKAEEKKELPATGDSANGVAAGIAVAGVAAIAGAEVLRRRRAE